MYDTEAYLTRNDMANLMHLAVWPPKSSLTPNSEILCDITVECGLGGEHKVQPMVKKQNKNFEFQKHIYLLNK